MLISYDADSKFMCARDILFGGESNHRLTHVHDRMLRLQYAVIAIIRMENDFNERIEIAERK